MDNTIQTTRTFCRICTSLCGLLVDTEGDQIVDVRGDPDHPLTQGYTCPKGRALKQLHHHPSRLERPMLKRNGELEAVSWDECFDDLAASLQRIIDQHGSSAIGVYFGSGIGMDAAGYRTAELLHAALGTPAKFSPLTIDGTAKVLVASHMGGFPGFNPRPDYTEAKLILYVGVNPVVSHGHAVSTPIPPSKAVQRVSRRGETWMIDPVANETSRFVTHHMTPLPGRDYAILGHLLRELLAQCDLEALESRCSGVASLREAVAPYTASYAAEVADVPEAQLVQLLASVQRAGRVAVETGTGVTMAETANITQWFAWALMIVTDSMNRPGGVWFHPGYFSPMDLAPIPQIAPEHLFAPGPSSRPDTQSFLGEWPCAVLPSEIEAGNIKAFLNLGGHLLAAFPDANALQPALEKLEVMLTLDIVDNETVALSTHVMPTKDQLERPDLTLWDFLSSRVSGQYTEAVIEPVGERRSTWWILSELMRRLHFEVPPYLGLESTAANDTIAVAAVAQYGRQPLAEWQDSGYTEAARDLPAAWVDEFVTTNGGWDLSPQILVEQHQTLKSQVDGVSEPSREPQQLLLVPRRQSRHLNAQLLFLGDRPEILLHPDDAMQRGISDGEDITISNPRGTLTGIAKVTDRIRVGVVSVPHGFEEANVNRLTDQFEVDPITGMARYGALPVNVSAGP